MQFLYKDRYLKRFDRFSAHEQRLILAADQEIHRYYESRQAPVGLRIKLLHASGDGKVFEARASQAIRIVWAQRPDLVSFLLVGTHDEVQRFLRSPLS
ncbi:MAG: hypothetical protein HY597_02365 [Candidatus Omnitrophica bacterium]|nr:hypothetical protein [Candidatus Omnitrophota bacterium]